MAGYDFRHVFDFLEDSVDLWQAAGELSNTFLRKGRSVGLEDCYAAVSAAKARVKLLTLDKHFALIKGAAGIALIALHEVPTLIDAGISWVGISTKVGHTVGIKTDGTLWSWGYDAYGQLGLGAPVDRLSPVQLVSPVQINNNEWQTKSATVTLSLDAGDENGIAWMRFSNDGVTWSGAEIYAPTWSRTLEAGDGLKTVYVQFQDAAGNWSAVFSDSIELHQAAP